MACYLAGAKPLSGPMLEERFNTFRPRHMDAIWQTTFSSAFSWMKMFEFLLKFHWSLFLRVKLTIFQHWFSQWLGAYEATSHYLNQWWLVYQRIYASLGPNELTMWKYWSCLLSALQQCCAEFKIHPLVDQRVIFNLLHRISHVIPNIQDFETYGNFHLACCHGNFVA